MQLADGASAFKTQAAIFCGKRGKAGRFFMQKAATKILKPLDKYNGGGGGIMNQNRGLPYARKEENASGERPLKQCGGF